MATKKKLDPSKIIAELQKAGRKDALERSAIASFMTAILVHATNQTQTRKTITELQNNFVDWNEVRVSPQRELHSVLIQSGIEDPWKITGWLQEVLNDIYEQYNIVNFEFAPLDANLLTREARTTTNEEGEEQDDIPTIREEGLPAHPEHSGFLDGHRLLKESTILEPKLVRDKNGEAIYMLVYDNPQHITSRLVLATAISLGLVDEDVIPAIGMMTLRQTVEKQQIDFARAAIINYEVNSRAVDKFLSKIRDTIQPDEAQVPVAVQLGLQDPNAPDEESADAPLPRSDGIGRLSKRAQPKLAKGAKASTSRTSSRTPAVSKKASGRKKAVKKK